MRCEECENLSKELYEIVVAGKTRIVCNQCKSKLKLPDPHYPSAKTVYKRHPWTGEIWS